jgi:hypothetical protein
MTTADQIALLALIISVGALAATVLIALSTKADVRAQLKTAMQQIDEAKRQFVAQNEPDVEFRVHVQLKPPEQAGVWLRVTNHHPTVAVNELLVYLVGDGPNEKEAYTLMFLTFNDLKPQQTLQERSLQSLDSALEKHFPGSAPGSAHITHTPIGGDSFDRYPVKLHYTYTPRYAGAKKVEGTRDLFLEVLRGKTPAA